MIEKYFNQRELQLMPTYSSQTQTSIATDTVISELPDPSVLRNTQSGSPSESYGGLLSTPKSSYFGIVEESQDRDYESDDEVLKTLFALKIFVLFGQGFPDLDTFEETFSEIPDWTLKRTGLGSNGAVYVAAINNPKYQYLKNHQIASINFDTVGKIVNMF